MNKEVIKQNLEVRIKLTVNGMKVKKYVKKMKRITKLLDELDNALQDLDDSEFCEKDNSDLVSMKLDLSNKGFKDFVEAVRRESENSQQSR